ncbi:MAG: 2OG-Fe(II) oxygenase [Elusimicrobia bacterium]|nr:2OG-Fe(II) oxygenase [Elusimicrobiota bacterium]
MADSRLLERMATLFDDPRYARLAVRNRRKFRANKPFPHIVFDNFLPPSVARLLAAEYPRPDDKKARWKNHSNANVSRRFVEDVGSMSLPLRLFADAVVSKPFLLFLEVLSGIDCLLGDPYFLGGGAMATGRNGFLKIHADFDWHHKLQAHRRVNALFYLTPGWKPEWAGDLELWSKDMKRKVSSVQPVFNRVVIFEVSDDANHGQPEPLRCPPDEMRRVFSAFYYTTRKSNAEWKAPHFTLYKPQNSPYSMSLQKDYKSKAAY